MRVLNLIPISGFELTIGEDTFSVVALAIVQSGSFVNGSGQSPENLETLVQPVYLDANDQLTFASTYDAFTAVVQA